MESLPAAMFVAGHTGSSGCFTLSALVLTDITRLHTGVHTIKINISHKDDYIVHVFF